jgi:ATPase subunit of ABC transporter with duplicated ATPase domains
MEKRIERLDTRIEQSSASGTRKQGIRAGAERARSDRLCAVAPGTIPLGGGRVLAALSPSLPLLYIPQEISIAESQAAQKALGQETEARRGEILARFSRLGSEPALLLRSALPSPGEIRKLLIARGVLGRPSLIILDEPVNHLDLSSIRILEETLREIPCALLLVSHDEAFLAALTSTEWEIRGDELVIH